MRSIALLTFTGGICLAGTALALTLAWKSTETLGLLGVGGLAIMALAAQGAFRDSPQRQLRRNRLHHHLSQPYRRNGQAPSMPSTGPSGRYGRSSDPRRGLR